MINFMTTFGSAFKKKLILANGNVDNVDKIEMGNTRPIFNSFYYKFHGQQILINDTELTEIQLDGFELSPTRTWEAYFTFTIYDHFGLDKNDALSYQGYNQGFADWWLLQHKRGFVPFITKIVVRKKISGNLE